jgi:ankyrin repeat protein
MFVTQEDSLSMALMWAARDGHTEAVKALIENGADVKAKEKVQRRYSVSTEEGAAFPFSSHTKTCSSKSQS